MGADTLRSLAGIPRFDSGPASLVPKSLESRIMWFQRTRLCAALVSCGLGVALLLHPLWTSTAQAVNLDWSTVGNPGNAPDQLWFSYGRPYGYGAVGQTFRIMTFEFTNSQYTAFLNAVDPSGSNPYSVYNSMMGQYGGIVNTGTVNGGRYVTKANMGSSPIGTTWFSAARNRCLDGSFFG
jgi:hypothetical protein